MNQTRTSPGVPGIADIEAAQVRIHNRVRQTPVFHDDDLDAKLGCRLYCKCEHLQRTGSFKFRGASNAVAKLHEQGLKGDVATHSSGNHGAALALAAHLEGRTAHVVMPENASRIKIDAVQRRGGMVHFCEPTQQAREAGLAILVAEGLIPIPPYDDYDIIAGQGTSALELFQTVPDIEFLIAPVGGGGLVAGCAIAAADRGIKTFAAEPAGASDTAASMAQGRRVESWQPNTIADGLRAVVGVRNFCIIQNQVEKVLTVSDAEIREAMMLFWQYSRMIIEPSSAVVIAAVSGHPEIFSQRDVGVIISGANLTPEDWIALTAMGKSS